LSSEITRVAGVNITTEEAVMVELLKRAMYASTGLAFSTKEKLEEAAKKFAEEAKLSETEGRKFVDELLRKSGEAKETLEKTVRQTVEKALAGLDLASGQKLRELEQRVARLEEKVK
jgi:polyhydroxyalkanoate synthesis regulator phasin